MDNALHNKIIHLILLAYCITCSYAQSIPFTARDMHLMHRDSSTVLSPNHKYIVFAVRKWNNDTGISSTHLMYTNMQTQESFNLTEHMEGRSDNMPQFSSAFPNIVLFMRNNSIYYKQFPPSPSSPETQLTSYPIPINDFKIQSNSLIFSANVYFNCTTLQCSSEQILTEESHSYQTYDRLYMFNWDTWLPQGKGSHIFMQKVSYDSVSLTLSVNGDPRDLTMGMEINAPPYDTGNAYYDVSRDGKMVAFTGHLRDYYETFKSDWKIYFVNVDEMDKPVVISRGISATTQCPLFSKDQTQIAFLAMVTPMSSLHLVIYNILTNTLSDISINDIDKSISGFEWYKHNEIVFIANAYQVDAIYKVNFADIAKPIYSTIPIAEETSYSALIAAVYTQTENYIITTKVAFDLPEQIVKIDMHSHTETLLLNMNKHITDTFILSKPTPFTYTGAYNDTVYGWVLNPSNFNASSQYPAVLLIHGGPESSWSSGWSYRWNPQIWAHQGYVVFMINPHGSTGFSSAYRDSVRTDWGGAPYEDIMKVFDVIEANYAYVDMNRIGACGASYGGYMMNWLQGHTDRLKCLVNHDGAFSTVSKFYATDEIFFQRVEYCPRRKSDCNPFDGGEVRNGIERNSPERYVKEWKTPMLVIHGGRDYRVPLTEGISTFTALQLKNIESRMLYFPMENHWVLKPENSIKWNDEVISWLDKYLK